jgi:hypothetical protein
MVTALYKSSDGGTTWSKLGGGGIFDDSGNLATFDRMGIGRIVVDYDGSH